ncbi:MAG TPA: TonB-dependent receptor, partial [Phnomibacter sp.]|nr:TonB-dependent receptor [Phnomibacter sp.]
MRHFFWTFLFYMLCQALQGQNARISGKVENERGQPMSGVNITILGRQEGTTTNDSGRFSIPVKPNRSLALVFTYQGYQTQQRNFLLNANEEEQVYLRLMLGASTLQEVVVTNTPERRESGLVRINPKLAQQSPAPIMGIENLIKVLVGSNNELSSQYNVRGGSYDENLVYVNDFEIYRPFLIRSGQQEGLSFINPALARNVNFYNGGFQARYGDKMSSVLDVQYKRPTSLGGSAYVGLLEQGAHAEGSARGGKISFLAGARNRSLRNLLSSQQTKGNYLPSSADVQTLITWQPNNRWSFEWLTNLAKTQFTLEPQESQQTISVFTPLFSANLGLDVDFYGRETDTYTTLMTGLSATRQVNPYLKLKGMLSYFRNQEQERINIGGSYLFGDREFDKASADFGLIVNPLGAGVFLDYARNRLDVQVANATLRGVYDKNNHYLQFGSSLEQNRIADVLQEFNYQDSAGYSLPYQTGPLFISRTLQGGANLNITRLTGFIQDNLVFNNLPGLTLQAGLRYNYNTLNQEFLLQPRAGVSFKPRRWKRDVIWKASAGLYHQPPFYREMRRFDGSVNTQLKAQRSAQLSAGADYAFKMLGRPFRLSTEAYYKNMWQVVPYDIDNVRLRYFGENMAKAYAYGLET